MKRPHHPDEVHLRDYLYVLRKRRWVMILFTIFVFVAGVVYTFQEKIIYRATSTILIERESPNIVDFKEVMSFDASTTDYYQTQYQMLKSRTLIESLIEKEGLDQDPHLMSTQSTVKRFLAQYEKWLPEWGKGILAKARLSDTFARNMLRIDPVRNSRLVHVSVLHPDAERAAEITNRLVELFIERNLQERFSISQHASELLSTELVELKEKVSVTEKALQQYKEKHGLINIPSIREKDEFIQDAKLELVKIQAEEAKLSKRYLPAHPKLISIRSQIEGLAEKIQEEEKKTLDLSRVAIEYSELEREADTSRRIYESLLERLEQTQSASQTQASNITVVDKAIPPSKPHKPRPLLNLMISLLVGLLGGIFLTFFAEYLDPTVRIPDDVEKGLGLEVFGIIPKVARSWRKGPAKGELFFSPATKASNASEAFRALRTALLFKMRDVPGCRVLLITSANPEEGKSTVSLNLTKAFEQNHLRVLLIDGDLRKPRLHKLFDFGSEGGLADILNGKQSFDAVVHKNAGDLGFDFLSCGTHSERPTEILGSEAMKQTLEEMKLKYDLVVIDSPPFQAVADVAVLNEFADAIVLVARYHKTHRRHLKDVERHFGSKEKRILGVVINQVGVREKDYYYNQYYYYGYGDARK